MRSRVDVWPSLTDLFSALLVATFGGLIMITRPPAPAPEPAPAPASVAPPPCVDVVAREVANAVRRRLERPLEGKVRETHGDDVCIDVYFNFELNEDEIRPEDREKLQQACQALKTLFQDEPHLKQEVEIWIEGHTDATQPENAATPRDRALYNWRLSSNRAVSVLYEFSQCGVEPKSHRIRAVGYADTVPLPKCGGKTDCQENRRTTFRIRPDKAVIAGRSELCTRKDCEPPSRCRSEPADQSSK